VVADMCCSNLTFERNPIVVVALGRIPIVVVALERIPIVEVARARTRNHCRSQMRMRMSR
jgi:hypothetical protein